MYVFKFFCFFLAVLSESVAAAKNNARSKNETVSGTKRFYLQRELDQWKDAVSDAKNRGYSIRGFYHTSSWQPHWQDVVEEQLLIMDGKRQHNHFLDGTNKSVMSYSSNVKKGPNVRAGLSWGSKEWASVLAAADDLYLNVAGKTEEDLKNVKKVVESLNLKYKNKITFNFNRTIDRQTYSGASLEKKKQFEADLQVSEGEYSTVTKLRDYCVDEVKNGRKAVVFYIHSKGGCCSRQTQKFSPVASWREAMNTFNIEFPSVCLRAMLDGYLTCGFEYQMRHYSGNFWWADCNHVSSLPAIWTRFDAWIVEFFVFNVTKHEDQAAMFAENCGFSTHNCKGVDHYNHECPRSTYKNKLMKYITNRELPFSEVATRNNSKPWRHENCGRIASAPYMKQKMWEDWGAFPWGRDRQPIYQIG